MADIIHLKDVWKWVGPDQSRTEILKGVSMSVQPGEFVAIMGASGSGKSTLLNIIGLLDQPSSGQVFLAGKDVSTLEEDEMASMRAKAIGFIFQSFNLISYLTALDNVALPMGYTGRTMVMHRSETLLKQMNLGHRLTAYPTTLSGGERQRVAIARALANEPALLLADEPTGALDSATGGQILRLLRDLNEQGVAIVLVTHDEQVARHAHRVMHMRDGRFS